VELALRCVEQATREPHGIEVITSRGAIALSSSSKIRVQPSPHGPALLDRLATGPQNGAVSKNEIDRYLSTLDERKRATLSELRDTILAIVPDAEQCISYGMPAFKVRGKTIAGFAAFKSHLSYLPHSGSVISALAEETAGYATTKGSLHFAIDKPLPKKLVKKLVDIRMADAFGPAR
jgi:uncharacterized protein YdhG (YjbR/CyaY superfamily)